MYLTLTCTFRLEESNRALRAEWEEARSVLNKASDAAEETEMLQEQHVAMTLSLQTAVHASQEAENRARRADAEADVAREEQARLEGLLEESILRAELAATQRSVLEGALDESKSECEELQKAIRRRA